MTVLAFLLLWAGLIAFVLLAVNRYRDHLEWCDDLHEEVIAYIGPKRVVRKGLSRHRRTPGACQVRKGRR